LKRKFILNLILLILLNLIIKPFWVFGIDRMVQNQVGLSEYGILFTLFNFSVIFNIFLDLGINNYNNTRISKRSSTVATLFPNIVVLKFMLAIAYFIITFSCALFLGYEGRYLKLLFLLTFNQFLVSYTLYLRTNISGLQLFTLDSVLSVSDRFFMILCCIAAYFAYFKKHAITIEWYVLIQTLSYMVSCIVILGITISKVGKIKFRFIPKASFKIIWQSIPYALLIFLMSAYYRIDSIMLQKLLPDGKEQAGIYAQSFRILDSANMITVLFAGLLLPMFSNLLAKKENIKPFAQMTFHLLWVIAFTFSFATFLYARQWISLLYTSGGDYSVRVFSILILTFIPVSVVSVFGTLITASGNLKLLNITSAISLFFNILFNLILIPKMGAKGAAISSLSTQIFIAIAQTIIIKKQFNSVMFNSWRLIFYSILTITAGALIYTFIANWFAAFIIIGVSGIISGSVTGILPIKEFIHFLKEMGQRNAT
jgi:O-antigen/teichoic acid export membrane protein